MSALRVRYQTYELGDIDIHVRSLRDTNQFDDVNGLAAALGVQEAYWPLFGVVWDGGEALADLMSTYEIRDRRVLEVGCGLALASLVLNHRDADITATDHHPRAEDFLEHNVALNGGEPIPFVRTGWADEDDGELGRFELIIGSDLLYERPHVDLLASFIDRHAASSCEVIVVDPGRGHRSQFTTRMTDLGYAFDELDTDFATRILRFTRHATA